MCKLRSLWSWLFLHVWCSRLVATNGNVFSQARTIQILFPLPGIRHHGRFVYASVLLSSVKYSKGVTLEKPIKTALRSSVLMPGETLHALFKLHFSHTDSTRSCFRHLHLSRICSKLPISKEKGKFLSVRSNKKKEFFSRFEISTYLIKYNRYSIKTCNTIHTET